VGPVVSVAPVDLSTHIGNIARRLLGPPNDKLSGREQLRFGTNGSVAVEIDGTDAGKWFDHEQKIGGGPWDLLHLKGGMLDGVARDWLRSEIGIELSEPKAKKRIVAQYDYRDEQGELLFQVCRMEPKDFRQRRPDGNRGWIWSTKGVRQVPYRLGDVTAGRDGRIYVVEGEKDADRLAGLGLIATTNPGGAGKWNLRFSQYFEGAEVAVIADNDQAGRDHACAVASNLAPAAANVRVLELRGLPEKGDVSDWLDAGGTIEELDALVAAVPIFDPPAKMPLRAPPGSLDEIVDKFAELYANDLRYVAPWGKWLHWDGTRWKFEQTLLVFDMARKLVRQFANLDPELAQPNVWASVERGARSDRRLAAVVSQWDTDPWLLNTPGGIIDLRTGRLLPHDPAKYLTKITAVAPGDGECPLWNKFLARVTGGNYELELFLQQIAGYALTGSVQEHALFFLYGKGRNGKGVYLNTLSKILSEYAQTAPMETFVVTQGSRHPTELAGLRGARLVTSQETEENQRWAESKIKNLTGGDPISARFMHQDFFEFDPAFKLFIAGNHKPALRGVDEAIKSRMNLVPFTVTIPKEERDKELPEKLKAEWSSILQWAINGRLAWQRQGLAPPKAVLQATQEYLKDEDILGQWIEDCCIVGSDQQCPSDDLWASWKAERERANEYVGTQNKFGRSLTDRGFRTTHSGKTIRLGINLKPKPEPERSTQPIQYYCRNGCFDLNDAPTQRAV
jgi:putative DNA primase/helicase